MFKKVPHTFVIIFFLIISAAILTWIIPGGEYYFPENTNGLTESQPEFRYTENVKQWWHIFAAFFSGFERQAGIIVFIMLIGGTFWIINSSKAIDVGIFTFIRYTEKLRNRSVFRYIKIEPVILTAIWMMFSVFGAVFGMSEETIAFIVIMVPLAVSMGYDSITGVSVVFMAAGIGFAGAMLNPFTIGIAQGIAGLPLFSGLEYRLLCWIVLNFAGLFFLLRYASKVKKDPLSSPVYDTDAYWRENHSGDIEITGYYTPKSAWWVYGIILVALAAFSIIYPLSMFSTGSSINMKIPALPVLSMLFALTGYLSLKKSVHFFLMQMLLFTILFLIAGVMGYEWYIKEIATLFFALGIASGIAIRKTPDEIVRLFLDGVKDILPAALIVGLAGGIIVILEDGQVIDTILYKLSEAMKGFGEVATAGFMYLIQTGINLIMVSGSAKAALTMPIFAPFSDLVGLSRQVTVLAYQFGDGFTNMITPASAVLMGVLGMAKIPYEKWFKWILPFMIFLILLGFLLIIPAVTMDIRDF